jgi:hypothetical protein
MFGQNSNQPNDQIPDQSIQGALDGSDPAQAHIQPVTDSQSEWGHPGVPIDNGQPATAPAVDQSAADAPQVVTPSEQTGAPQAAPAVSNDLIDIKQQALTQLSPLVGHLDQTPEEKFRTTMMMIQASDDQSLVPVAYEAANAITDEKAKAQALLDIVNEINYFTQHHQS